MNAMSTTLQVVSPVPTDIDIARSVKPLHIAHIAKKLNLGHNHYDLYGKYKAKRVMEKVFLNSTSANKGEHHGEENIASILNNFKDSMDKLGGNVNAAVNEVCNASEVDTNVDSATGLGKSTPKVGIVVNGDGSVNGDGPSNQPPRESAGPIVSDWSVDDVDTNVDSATGLGKSTPKVGIVVNGDGSVNGDGPSNQPPRESAGPIVSDWSVDDGDINLSTLVDKNVSSGPKTSYSAPTTCGTSEGKGNVSGKEQSFASLLGANSTSRKVDFRKMVNEDRVPNHDTKLPKEAMEPVLGYLRFILIGH
ncbi:formate--tetrahydrofolate ligase [Artemisia annua]|uniref:Formate--tetrahydrofolate ligase n=1 Tax=Artemisia annua TaxID=35608 RepID=A0A2U1P353_ARTAN|nr:formate--tetrahydrofolate ligase [Artemisia annua]